MNFTTNPVYKFILDTKQFGLEKSAKRWYSTYQGKVSALIDGLPGNVDGRQQGRISVNVPDLGIGQKVGENFVSADLPWSALPISPYAGADHGFYFPPEVGDSVWVSFEYGNIHQPRYLGGWWGNPAPGASAPATSELPKEFQTASGPPTARGIKTGFGHGLLFQDNPLAPLVALWSGKSVKGQEATKKQLLVLTDDPSDAGIGLFTFYGHYVDMNDTTKKFTISGRPRDPTGTIANSIEIDDTANKITIKSVNPAQSVVIDGTTMAITVTNPGVTTVNSVGPVNVSSAAAVGITAAAAATIAATGGIALGSGVTGPPIPTPGMMVEEGAGAKISTFAGDITEVVGGAFTQSVAGLFAQNVLGLMNISAAAFNLTAALLNLTGSIVVSGTAAFGPGTQKQLINQDLLLNWLATHTHPTAAPGPPSAPAQAILLQDPLNPSNPNPIWITQNLTAS